MKKNLLTNPVAHGITRRAGLLTLLGSALVLAGCGGGGGSGGVAAVGGGGTGSFSVGPITGFGSIIVNGVRFDDTGAVVSDDNGGFRTSDELKLGMVVRVKGGNLKPDGRKDANTIEVRSELLGPIDSIPSPQTTPPTLVVLGQTVEITATTVFEDGLTGLSALTAGNIVEVHGFVNPDPLNNRIIATRIERKGQAPAFFKLQGPVSAFSDLTKTFKIGSLTISFAAPVDMNANFVLANGKLVRVRLATTPTTGTRTALKIRAVDELEIKDCDESEVEGLVTSIDPINNKKFSVNGLPVDASGVSVPAGLKLGDRVEVEGSLVNGVLVAKKVELEVENDQSKFELHGTVSGLTSTTFVVRGVTVNYTTSVIDGLIANLKDGANVEVKGVISADGTKVSATRIKFE